jgi:hypothetical protein
MVLCVSRGASLWLARSHTTVKLGLDQAHAGWTSRCPGMHDGFRAALGLRLEHLLALNHHVFVAAYLIRQYVQ